MALLLLSLQFGITPALCYVGCFDDVLRAMSIPFVEDKTSMLLCLELAPLFLPGHAMCTIRINRMNGSGCSANAAALFAVMFSEHGGALIAWDSRAAARAPHEHSVLPKFGWQTQQMSSSFNPKKLTSALSPACATCTALWQ